MEHPLKKLIEYKNQGNPIGIYSACTANELAIKACMLQAIKEDSIVLIEATANQVDQYGGYTGMRPIDFYHFVLKIADEVGLERSKVILGGDHLGPLTFTHYDEEKAMEEAKELVRQYVLAGFTKIHLDTSMKVNSDDPNVRLSDEIIAKRGAILAKVCEEAFVEYQKENPNAIHPVYIVGSEVPIPGGSQDVVDVGVQVTKVEDFKATIQAFEKAFENEGLKEAFNYVIAVVVQPGVEEKDAGCTEYDRKKAENLMKAIHEYPNLIFEGHSTDYQTKLKLKELVEDGVGILKVGPALTYALREGLFALAHIEKVIIPEEQQSFFMEKLEECMLETPKYWQKHYHGTEEEIAYKRKYSFSDRARYFLPTPKMVEAQRILFENLKDGVPLGLLSQFMPIQYTKVRENQLINKPENLVMDRVMNCASEYTFATNQYKIK